MIAGSQAEYFDHVSRCGDCGSELVTAQDQFLQPTDASSDGPPGMPDLNAIEPDPSTQEMRTRMDVMTGIFGIVGGLGITIVTYSWALNGGVYLVAWGPMVFGIHRLTRALEADGKRP